MQRPWKKYAYACVALLALGVGAVKAQAPLDASEKEIERYRAMINDPMANPGYLAVDRGEALWALKRGAKNVSLEACDLGEGPGKLEGAYAKLPRFFKDSNNNPLIRVQDSGQFEKNLKTRWRSSHVQRASM